jgi:signal transduction histidine kinase
LELAISRPIIEAHGGRLWTTPNEGEGATIQFTLPLNTKQSAATLDFQTFNATIESISGSV